MLSKYLLCNFKDNNSVERMKRHYIDVHKVDEKNNFSKIYLKHQLMCFVEENI